MSTPNDAPYKLKQRSKSPIRIYICGICRKGGATLRNAMNPSGKIVKLCEECYKKEAEGK